MTLERKGWLVYNTRRQYFFVNVTDFEIGKM